MASPDWKLSILSFPQRWDAAAGRLELRVLVLPRGNPLEPLITTIPSEPEQPAFVETELTFELRFIAGLDALPDPAAVDITQTKAGLTPTGLRDLYEALTDLFPIAPPGTLPDAQPRRADTRILKYLPSSYRTAFPFSGPRTPRAVIDDSFRCALRAPPPDVPLRPPSPGMRWGQVIAGVLAQPRLAERLGLVYRMSFEIEASALKRGGWLYAGLASGTTYGTLEPPEPYIKLYAARVPPLEPTRSRALFAPVLFPTPTPALAYDEALIEAENWDDGFAKIAHSAQPLHDDLLDNSDSPGRLVQDAGVELGWDDEQVVIWLARQGEADPVAETRDAPLGVNGYRVDVRAAGSSAWTSLARVEGELKLGSFEEYFSGEHALRVAPTQLHGLVKGDYWLPAYLARWNGKSLCVSDDFSRALSHRRQQAAPTWSPVGVGDVPLRYGGSYEFRVRLADLSGGGPGQDDQPVRAGEAPVTTCRFRRFVPPKAVRVEAAGSSGALEPRTSYQVRRPLLGYPSLVYTDLSDAEQQLLADEALAREEGRELGLPDPDVTILEIEVAVLDPKAADEPRFRTLYTTTRAFPSNLSSALTLDVTFEDAPTLLGLSAPSDTGPLPLPRARDLRLSLTALCREDHELAYFGSQEARRGPPTFIATRAPAVDERDLFATEDEAEPLSAHMLEPDRAPSRQLLAAHAADGRQDEAPSDLAQRLAQRLGLSAQGLRFIGGRGRRTVFGCSRALNHALSPENGAITFASKDELAQQWIVAVSPTLARDWTWDGLADAGFEVSRRIKRLPDGEVETEVVGSLELKRPIHHWQRSTAAANQTRIIFFDAVDPKPKVGKHPGELEVSYTLTPRWKQEPAEADAPFSATIMLPIAAPPDGTPSLASAGIGLSPFRRAADYSSSDPRRRALWLEFAEAVANPRDGLFARVLGYAPDPMLTGIEPPPPPSPSEPPLPLPPEPIRSIVPSQPTDRSGLDAMQPLIASDSPRHFYLPLPPGLGPDSLELFGFFVYELRIGHAEGWSTARTRFGPPLRVTGIQHPAPFLHCEASRRRSEIAASAAYAIPVADGRNLMPRPPKTEIWGLLYAQSMRVDGEDRRNVLISRKRARPAEQATDVREMLETVATAIWRQQEIDPLLKALALPRGAPLSVLAVELAPELDRIPDPLGADLGRVRILRTSPLVPVPEVCL